MLASQNRKRNTGLLHAWVDAYVNEQRDERYIGCGCGFDEENSVLDEGAEKSYQMFRALILK